MEPLVLEEDADKRITQARRIRLFGAPVGIFVTVHKSVGPDLGALVILFKIYV